MSLELKKTLDGRLPEQDNPVCIEIQMETLEVRGGEGRREMESEGGEGDGEARDGEGTEDVM